jgi:hypothetical protein
MTLYRTVLCEGQRGDLTTYLHKDLLVEQWAVLRTADQPPHSRGAGVGLAERPPWLPLGKLASAGPALSADEIPQQAVGLGIGRVEDRADHASGQQHLVDVAD